MCIELGESCESSIAQLKEVYDWLIYREHIYIYNMSAFMNSDMNQYGFLMVYM